MALTDQQTTTLQQALNAKIKTTCPVCGLAKTRQLVPDLVLLPFYLMPQAPTYTSRYHSARDYTMGTSGNYNVPFPLPEPTGLLCVAVICNNCGFTELHNVTMLGLDKQLGISE